MLPLLFPRAIQRFRLPGIIIDGRGRFYEHISLGAQIVGDVVAGRSNGLLSTSCHQSISLSYDAGSVSLAAPYAGQLMHVGDGPC